MNRLFWGNLNRVIQYIAVFFPKEKKINPTNSNSYMTLPGRMAVAMACIKGIVRKLATVAGNIMMEDAKIGGITPD